MSSIALMFLTSKSGEDAGLHKWNNLSDTSKWIVLCFVIIDWLALYDYQTSNRILINFTIFDFKIEDVTS